MKLDIRNIFETPIRQFVPWLAVVLLVGIVAKQPGVVCVTPMAWLIALRVGIICVAQSRSETSTSRYLEAALAGGVLGFLQGILFAIVSAQMEPIGADDTTKAYILTIVMLAVGMFAGGVLAFITAYFTEQRRKRSISQPNA